MLITCAFWDRFHRADPPDSISTMVEVLYPYLILITPLPRQPREKLLRLDLHLMLLVQAPPFYPLAHAPGGQNHDAHGCEQQHACQAAPARDHHGL